MNRKNADRSKQKKKRTAKDIVLDILLVVFLLIAVGSGAYLGRYYYIAKNAQNNFNDLKGMLDTDGDDTEKVTVEVSDKVRTMARRRYSRSSRSYTRRTVILQDGSRSMARP